VGTFATSSK
jgi:hypothetical protein